MRIHDEVSEALAAGRPVVALESTIISHGLPRPRNLARRARDRGGGARRGRRARRRSRSSPARSRDRARRRRAGGDRERRGRRQVRRARPRAGRRARRRTARRRWPPPSALAVRAGIGVFATGGLGGVHREARETWDESADLGTLARTPITVVCAGVKSILDVGATLERLETLNVTVLGYGTDAFPGFYLADSGFPVPWRVDSPEEAAAVVRARDELGSDAAIVVANPLPEAEQLDPALHDARARATGSRRPGAPARRARTRRRSCSTSSTARPAARASRSTCGSCCATPSSRRGSPPRRREHRRRRRPDGRRRRGAAGRRSRTAATRRRGSRTRRAARAPTSPRGWRRPARTRRSRGARAPTRSATPRSRRWPASTLAVERDPERPTGTCIVLVHPGGERTMVPDAGANDGARAAPSCRAGGHLHLTGYTLLREGSRAGGPARARARARARDDRLRRPVLGGAARRRAAASRTGSRAPACCCPTPTRRAC